ncbi:hypothetical protein Tco_1071619 [Tanacetum coccineum]
MDREAEVDVVINGYNLMRPKVNVVSPKVNTVRSKQPVPHKTSNSMTQMAHSNAVMGSWGSAVKTSASYNWRNSRPNFNYNRPSTEETWLLEVYLIVAVRAHDRHSMDVQMKGRSNTVLAFVNS